MSIIIAILLWLGAIQPGVYTQNEFDQIAVSHQSQVSAVQADPILSTTIINETNTSVVALIVPGQDD